MGGRAPTAVEPTKGTDSFMFERTVPDTFLNITRFTRQVVCVAGLAIVLSPPVLAQHEGADDRFPTLAERLGYAADAKLLIIHADDIGLAHSVNEASLEAFNEGLVNSGSIMVPSPWFPEIAAYAREHPGLDLGLHLTLTSEWTHYRWGTVLPRDRVPTLLDSLGFMHATAEAAAQHIDPREAEAEIRAQVDRAIAFGIRPTHLDAHMGTLFQTPDLFDAYLRVGRDYQIPVFIPGGSMREQAPQLMDLLKPGDVVIDHLAMALPEVPAEDWDAFYARLIENLQPGVTEIIVHVGYDDAELRAVTIDHPDFGAAWRQRDLDVFTNPELKRLLEQHDVHLITWRELGALMRE
jgi:predicted glycoside hydrolase/deacetylase ChbG (UPF0249 family)